MNLTVQPGSTIGVLGSGQLGRMFAIAARRMGYRVHVLSPDDDTPTGQVADVEIKAAYEDADAVANFAKAVDVVSFEFENVLSETIDVVERFAPVRPAGRVLHTTQNRLREKTFLREAGLPVTPFLEIRQAAELAQIPNHFFPAVLKTASWGYDGKGQSRIDKRDDLEQVWPQFEPGPAILEQFVDFERELSVVAARGQDGSFAFFDPIENAHANHILDLSVSPADIDAQTRDQAIEIARSVFEQLDVIGVLCVEFFLTRDRRLLINELAPRPHNSGHLTIDAHISCQFEQQVRAVCGLPLGATDQLRPAAMANLLGDLWESGPPRWHRACADPQVKLHLYGKRDARIGRKMGHLTALGDNPQDALARVSQARRLLVADDE